MIYVLGVIGFMIGLCVWSMCRVAAKYDENFERLDQREHHSAKQILPGPTNREHAKVIVRSYAPAEQNAGCGNYAAPSDRAEMPRTTQESLDDVPPKISVCPSECAATQIRRV